MHSLETLLQLNAASVGGTPVHRLPHHPRIVDIRRNIDAMPVASNYKARLILNLYRYADQIVAQPEWGPEWSFFEDLQQVTLAEAVEKSLRQLGWREP